MRLCMPVRVSARAAQFGQFKASDSGQGAISEPSACGKLTSGVFIHELIDAPGMQGGRVEHIVGCSHKQQWRVKPVERLARKQHAKAGRNSGNGANALIGKATCG